MVRWKITPKPSGSTLQPMMSSVSGHSFSPVASILRRAAVAGAQHGRGRAVAEQAGRDDIGLGQFVMADRERAELERDQQHVGAGPRLRQARGDRQARDAAGAAETEHRHARDIAAKTHLARDARFQRRRGDAGRTDRDDGVDIGRRQDRPAPAPCARRRRTALSAPSRKACVRSGQPRRSRYHSIGFTP